MALQLLPQTGIFSDLATAFRRICETLNALIPQSGQFLGTLTGMTTTTSGNLNYVKANGIVYLYVKVGITGTSAAGAPGNAMTLTGLPAAIQPAGTVTAVSGSFANNGSGGQFGMASITGGVATLSLAQVSGTNLFTNQPWTSGGTKGIQPGWSISYPLT